MSIYVIFYDQSFNDTLTNDIVSFEQMGRDMYRHDYRINIKGGYR